MEHKDEENSEKPTVEDEAAAGSPAPPDVFTNGRILVKLRLPRTTDDMEEDEEEEEKEKTAEAAAEIYPPADQERKSHYCKECNKSFSCGKALGGHMSSAHVQANKDYSYRKLSSKMKRQRKDSGSAAAAEDNTCRQCGKVFRSKKSLFGHMRCHPERDWRGMEPPPRKESKIDSLEASSEPESEDAGQNQETEEEEEDDQIDSGSDIGARTGSDLKGWPTAAKRGRGPVIPAIRASVSSSEETETFVAGHQLIRLLKGESGARQGPESDGRNPSKKQKLDSGAQKLKIHERDAIDEAAQLRRKTENRCKGKEKLDSKGKAKANETSTMSLPDDIDSDDELYLTAIEVLVNGKRDQIENQKRVAEEKMDVPKLTSPEKYICNICNRSFPTHQALGGHRSSHNKFKLSIVNTADRRAKTAKERVQSKKDTNAKIVASNAADDQSETAEKVVLDFDLNMTPEEEGKDVDGDSSNHTSNS